jgi:transcriptional regulator with XRE-family HTH domain
MERKWLVDFLLKTCKEQGSSLRSLSKNAGLSPGTVHAIINRENEPSLRSLNQLADYLGVKRQYLWKLAGLLDDNDLDDKSNYCDPRMSYYCDKINSLPESTREVIINVMAVMIKYHIDLQESNTSHS